MFQINVVKNEEKKVKLKFINIKIAINTIRLYIELKFKFFS